MIPAWVTYVALTLLIPLALLAWRMSSFAVYVLLATLSAYAFRTSLFGIPTTWLELATYVVAVVIIIHEPKQVRYFLSSVIKRNTTWLLLLALWIVAGVIGVVVAQDTRIALGIFKGWIVTPLVIVLLVAYQAHVAKLKLLFWRNTLWSLLIGASVISCAAFVQSLWQHLPRLASGTDSPNVLAMFLSPIVMAAIAWLLVPESRATLSQTHRSWWVVLTLVSLLAVVLTGSYAAFVTVLAVFGFLALSSFTRVRKYLSATGLAVVFLGMALPALFTWQSIWPLPAHINATYGVSSGEVRLTMWRGAIDLGLEQPVFGLGLGQFKQAFLRQAEARGLLSITNPGLAIELTYASLFPHNLWLATWLQVGLLGVVILAASTHLVFREVRYSRLAIIPAAMLLAILMQGMVDTPLWRNDLVVVWLVPLLAAGSLSLVRQGDTVDI